MKRITAHDVRTMPAVKVADLVNAAHEMAEGYDALKMRCEAAERQRDSLDAICSDDTAIQANAALRKELEALRLELQSTKDENYSLNEACRKMGAERDALLGRLRVAVAELTAIAEGDTPTDHPTEYGGCWGPGAKKALASIGPLPPLPPNQNEQNERRG